MLDTKAPVARTPLHAWHQAHGAQFREQDGWQIVTAYSGAESEAAAARAGLGVADISAVPKLAFRGPGVSVLARSLVVDGAELPCGRVASLGGSGLACRLTDDHLLVLSATLPGRSDVLAFDVTSAYAGFALIGPRWDDCLRRLTHLDMRSTAFPINSCAETALCGVEALLVRPPAGALPAAQLYVAWDMGEYVWERVLQAGRDVPITPLGQEALALLR